MEKFFISEENKFYRIGCCRIDLTNMKGSFLTASIDWAISANSLLKLFEPPADPLPLDRLPRPRPRKVGDFTGDFEGDLYSIEFNRNINDFGNYKFLKFLWTHYQGKQMGMFTFSLVPKNLASLPKQKNITFKYL